MSTHRGEIHAVIPSPLPGVPYIAVMVDNGALSGIDYLQQQKNVIEVAAAPAQQAVTLLQDYFLGNCAEIPHLHPVHGTAFQHRVWQLLQQIPAGETRRYGELAAELGSSARAVARACRANPLAILIPCHRVVAASGLGGYMGQRDGPAVAIKRWLLHHEGHV